MVTTSSATSTKTIQTGREYWIDYLRIFASFLVVLIHVSSLGWYNKGLHIDWISANIGATLAHCSVPIFFMISGAIFLNPKRDLSIKKLLLHNFLRMYIIYLVSMLGYGGWTLYEIYKAGSMPLDSWHSILSILLQGDPYFWFLYAICGIYLLLPLLRMVTKDYEAGKKVLEYYIVLFLIVNISVYTIKSLQVSDLLNTTLTRYASFSLFQNYLGYFFLGYYLYAYGLSEKLHKVLKWLFIPSILCLIGYPVLQLYLGEPVSESVFDSYSVFTFITSANIFLFFKTRKQKDLSSKARKILITCSSSTLGVYILHDFVIHLFVRHDFTIWFAPLYLSIPIYTLLVFLVSLSLSYLLKLLGRFLSNLFKNKKQNA